MEMDAAGYLRALLDISPLSLSEIARRADMSKTAVSLFARGKGYLSEQARERVLGVLGVRNDRLTEDAVHFWVVGGDVEPIKRACELLFPHGGEIAGLWRQGRLGVDFRRAVDPGLWALHSPQARVVVKRTALMGAMPNAKVIGPSVLRSFKWRGGKVGSSQMVSIPIADFDRWSSGNITPSEFDQLLIRKRKASVDDVLQAAKMRKMTLDDVIKLIMEAGECSVKGKR